MNLNAQQDEITINFNKVRGQVTKGLKDNTSILIESQPGVETEDLIIDAVADAGLRSVTVELSKKRDPSINEAEYNKNLAKRIINLIRQEKSNALVVEAQPGNDISEFVGIAKLLNIPLVVTMTNESSLKAGIFADKDAILSATQDASNIFAPKNVAMERIKQMTSKAVETKSGNKLTR